MRGEHLTICREVFDKLAEAPASCFVLAARTGLLEREVDLALHLLRVDGTVAFDIRAELLCQAEIDVRYRRLMKTVGPAAAGAAGTMLKFLGGFVWYLRLDATRP